MSVMQHGVDRFEWPRHQRCTEERNTSCVSLNWKASSTPFSAATIFLLLDQQRPCACRINLGDLPHASGKPDRAIDPGTTAKWFRAGLLSGNGDTLPSSAQ